MMIRHTPVLIAAAGTGSRLGLGRPKCLVPVNGVPIINYLLFLLREFSDIRIITGFCQDAVQKHVAVLRPDARFIVNNDYAETTTLQSLFLGAQGIVGKCLCIDGDMILEEQSFEQFLGLCAAQADHQACIAVSEGITEEPVYALAHPILGALEILSFTTKLQEGQKAAHEWANAAHIPAAWLTYEHKHFFRALEGYLPCPGGTLRRLEVDTRRDLAHAEGVLRGEPAFCRYLTLDSGANGAAQ